MRRPKYRPPAPDAAKLLRAFPIAKMRERRQWVAFRLIDEPGATKPVKLPFRVPDARACAKSTDPATWGTFADALAALEAGRVTAAGYALDGDAIGIDLDGGRWVNAAGAITPEAREIVDRAASYAELSVSGRGLHILLAGELPGRGRRNDRVGVEIYARKRFFVVTGRRLPDAPAELRPNPQVVDLVLQLLCSQGGDVAERRRSRARGEDGGGRDKMAYDSPPSCAHSATLCHTHHTPEEIIAQTQPAGEGERNACLLRLARGLKFEAGLADAPLADVKPIVRRWHAAALPVIGTQPFDPTWRDFVRAFDAARVPLSEDPVAAAFRAAEAGPLPPEAQEYDTPAVRVLVGACRHLAAAHAEGVFWLSSHGAGRLLDMHPETTLRTLRMLVADGVLELVERGNPAKRRANRYKWKGKTP